MAYRSRLRRRHSSDARRVPSLQLRLRLRLRVCCDRLYSNEKRKRARAGSTEHATRVEIRVATGSATRREATFIRRRDNGLSLLALHYRHAFATLATAAHDTELPKRTLGSRLTLAYVRQTPIGDDPLKTAKM